MQKYYLFILEIIQMNAVVLAISLLSPRQDKSSHRMNKALLMCNTPLPEYVLSCVFRFFDRIF